MFEDLELLDAANDSSPRSGTIRWAGLAGREQGGSNASGPSFVLLHGLTFDQLEDGLEVVLNIEEGKKGLQATTVNPLPAIQP
jgi:hypothetical protein